MKFIKKMMQLNYFKCCAMLMSIMMISKKRVNIKMMIKLDYMKINYDSQKMWIDKGLFLN